MLDEVQDRIGVIGHLFIYSLIWIFD